MKVIGIVGRAYYNKDNQKIIQTNEAIRRAFTSYEDVTIISILPTNNENYVDMKMGEDKITMTDRKKLDYILKQCDGFVIPGGSSWYQFDEYVIKYAIKNNKPLLAICAGFQALCSMYAINRSRFDMTSRLEHDKHYGEENQYMHHNKVIDHTLLKKIIGKDTILVNSLHHDYVDFELNDLLVSSVSEDGMIEAVELPKNRFGLGVQWHPEYLMDEDSKNILDYFVKCC